jgi:ADP-ribose pyrophosphatase YjhB (NUDIX family)
MLEYSLVKDISSFLSAPGLWLTSRANRQRLRGARVEIMAVVLCKHPEPSVFLVRSVYDACWMPPQEGVNLKESLLDALARGLWEECAVKLLDGEGKCRSEFYIRDIRYEGTLELPFERWGERGVAGNVGDGPFSHVFLKRKAYWSAFIIVDEQENLQSRPNLREIDSANWVSFSEVGALIESNREEKRELITNVLRRGLQHLIGARQSYLWMPDSGS